MLAADEIWCLIHCDPIAVLATDRRCKRWMARCATFQAQAFSKTWA